METGRGDARPRERRPTACEGRGSRATGSSSGARRRSPTGSGRRPSRTSGSSSPRPWDSVYDDSRGPEWTTWFNGATVSIARNCVHRWAERDPDRIGAVFAGEDGSRRELTSPSSHETSSARRGPDAARRRAGRPRCDLPAMCPEVAIASHACAHLGAVQVPLFSGFAAPAVVQRLLDSEAKVVITLTTRCAAARGSPCARRGGGRPRCPPSSTWSPGSGTPGGARSSREPR